MKALVLIVMLPLSILVAPLAVKAQPPTTVHRVGWLSAGSPHGDPGIAAFRQGLRALGYVEGQTLVLESGSVAKLLFREFGSL